MLDFLNSIITPFTYAITITILYLFIFELERIKIIIMLEDYERKHKKLMIIRGICIFLTFIPVVLIAVININFSVP